MFAPLSGFTPSISHNPTSSFFDLLTTSSNSNNLSTYPNLITLEQSFDLSYRTTISPHTLLALPVSNPRVSTARPRQLLGCATTAACYVCHCTDVYVATELMDTDVHQIIRSHQNLSEEHCQYFLYQILRGLKYIHSANVIHRDLKPSNLLINANCDLKICDFGLARPTSENEHMTEYVVTRWYRAPELLLNSSDYTAAIDLWSVGCIYMELMNRRPLFPGKDHVHQMRLLTELLGTPTEADLGFLQNEDARRYIRQLPPLPRQPLKHIFPHVNPLAIDLIEKMLTFDPTRRITVEEALSHPYLARLHDISDEPVCQETFSFEFEKQALGEEEMKEMIYQEALALNPSYA